MNEGKHDEGAETYTKSIELAHRLKRETLADAISIRRSISLLAAGREGEREVVSAFERASQSDVTLKLLQYEARRVLSDHA